MTSKGKINLLIVSYFSNNSYVDPFPKQNDIPNERVID